MTRQCDLTGKKVQYGHKVSHSNHKTNRRFEPNLQVVSLYSDALKKYVSLRVATSTIRSVDHNGGLDGYLITAKSHKLTVEAATLKRQIKRARAAAGVPLPAKKMTSKEKAAIAAKKAPVEKKAPKKKGEKKASA